VLLRSPGRHRIFKFLSVLEKMQPTALHLLNKLSTTELSAPKPCPRLLHVSHLKVKAGRAPSYRAQVSPSRGCTPEWEGMEVSLVLSRARVTRDG
jgi:hypothetical protein